MLGPIRFQHIESCARAALSQYMIEEALEPLRHELLKMDNQIISLRSQLGVSTPVIKVQYENLDLVKAQRLILARTKVIEMLQKRIEAPVAPTSQMESLSGTIEANDKPGGVSLAAEKAVVQDTILSVADGQTQSEEPSVVKEEEDDLTGWDALE